MKSPSVQCDLFPFELPFTQFAYFVSTPDVLATLPTRQGSREIGGPTAPFVHWSMFAAADAADAGMGDSAIAKNITATPPGRPRRLVRSRLMYRFPAFPPPLQNRRYAQQNGAWGANLNSTRDCVLPPLLHAQISGAES